MVQGASRAQEVRDRKASPEGPGERWRRKPKPQERFGRHRKDGSEGASWSTVRNGRPGKLRRGVSQASTTTGTPRQDQDAGSRPAGGASRTHEGAGERADSQEAQARCGSRARRSTGRRELAAAGGEGRKARAKQRRHNPQADSRRAGVKTSTRAGESRRREQAATDGQRHARGPLRNEGAEARAATPERGRPEGWPEGRAGDEGCELLVKRRSRKAAGGLGGCEERKLRAETQPESEARGSSRETELRARPKGQGKGAGRKASSERTRVRTEAQRRPENRQTTRSCRFRPDVLEKARAGDQSEAGPKARRKPGRRQRRRAGTGSESRRQVPRVGRKPDLRQGQRRGVSQAGGSAAGQADEESWRIGSRRASRKAGSRQGRRRGASQTEGSAAGHEGQLN